jgi:replicative DNA helicase
MWLSCFTVKICMTHKIDRGEADLIVAKHRNGPTRTITVSAQLHLARFTDMAANFAPTEKFVKDN